MITNSVLCLPARPQPHPTHGATCAPRRQVKNALSSRVLSGGVNRTAELQQHRASGLTLVTAAIVLWNTVYLGRALDALRRHREVVSDALLAHIAPLGWQHINLTGDYLWDVETAIGPTGFRPLRGVEAPFAQVA